MDFKKLASEAVSGSFVMSGRKELKNDDVIKGFPNGVTITGFDIVPVTKDDGSTSEMPVYTIAENDAVFCKGGGAHLKVFRAWLDAAGADATTESVSAELKSAGGVKVKVSKVPIKNGKTYTNVEVI